MITIMKGSKTLDIPVGAYNTYASAGWRRLEDATSPKPVKDKGNARAKTKEAPVEPVSEPEEDVEYVDPEELLEKPLEDLDFEELKLLAEYLGIDFSGMKTSKAIRSAIRKHNKS